MRGIAQENLYADMGQLELIGTELPIHSTGPCEHPAWKPPHQPWAYPTVSEAAVHKMYWPIPANGQNLEAPAMGPPDSLGSSGSQNLLAIPTNRQNLEAPAMGPCEGLHQKAYRLPWASSSSSAQECRLTARPRASVLFPSCPPGAENMGPRELMVWNS
jgi:hypothetical protein